MDRNNKIIVAVQPNNSRKMLTDLPHVIINAKIMDKKNEKRLHGVNTEKHG